MNETLKRTDKLDFSFDKVFEQQSSQAEVFEEISQLVQVCVAINFMKAFDLISRSTYIAWVCINSHTYLCVSTLKVENYTNLPRSDFTIV